MAMVKKVTRSYTLHQSTQSVDVLTQIRVFEGEVQVASDQRACAYSLGDKTRFLSDNADDAQSSSLAEAFGMVDEPGFGAIDMTT